MDAFGLPVLGIIFALAAAAVVASGIVLARTGDQIASRTGLGGLLVGMLLLAGATSLPEVATDVSASLAGAPDLAVGDLFGSSMANMAILAVVDLLHRGRVWPSVGVAHARLASIAIGLTCIAILGIAVPSGIAVGWIGIESFLIVGGYVAAARWMRRSPTRSRRARDGVGEIIAPTGWGRAESTGEPLRLVVLRFGLAAFAVLLFAPVLALTGQAIAAETGIGETFIGTILLAFSTSIPELVASIAAVRIGAYDLAVGNLFGSNAFNMVALFAADAAYLPGPILAAVSPAQVIGAVGAMLLMSIALAAVVHGERTRALQFEPDAVLLLVVWVVMLGAVYAGSLT